MKKTAYAELVQKVNAIRTNDASNLLKKAYYKEIKDKNPDHDKYITTIPFYKFSAAIIDERLKQEKLAADIILILLSNVLSNIKKKLETFDFSYFLDKIFFGNTGSQTYLVFQPLYDTVKRLSSTETIVAWKSKGLLSESIVAPIATDNIQKYV